MKHRCNNPNAQGYRYWGGRGIRVCSLWTEDFEAFYSWALASGYEIGLQIDRIDNDGDYRPDNCRFVTAEQQAHNRGSKWTVVDRRLTRALNEVIRML